MVGNSPVFVNDLEAFFELIIDHDGLKKFIPEIDGHLSCNPTAAIEFLKIKKNLEEAVEICMSTIQQTSAKWLVERKLRITGSISYNLYTYASNKNPDWNKKLSSIYNSTFKGNESTKYGLHAEKMCKEKYGLHCLLFECGLLISPDIPFLAVSPDGVAYNGDKWKLVEIKSPVKGKYISAKDLIKTLPYLELSSKGIYELKERHPYYGQMQLGLALTNLSCCDLVIFSSFNKSYETITVLKNVFFIEQYIKELMNIYFNYVMPFIFKK